MFKFFKKKKISPTDEARRILRESGWLEKYYYTYMRNAVMGLPKRLPPS